MLKYTIKAGISPNLNEIKYTDLYLAKDLSFISGITDYYEGIRDGEEVSVSSPFLDGNVRLPIRLELVHRQGYVLTKEKFPIHTINHVGDNDESINYIEYNGVFYYEFNKSSLDGFLVDNIFYTKNPNNTVTLPVKNWIENGTVYIKGVKYYADMNLVPNTVYSNGYEPPLIKNAETDEVLSKVDGTVIEIIDYEYSKWKNVYKFAIYNINRFVFDATSAITAMYMPFVKYKDEIYPIQDIYDSATSSTTYGCLINETIYPLSGIHSVEYYYNAEDAKIIINDEEIAVESNLKKANPGLILMLYGNIDTSVINIGDILTAENDYHLFEVPVLSGTNGNKYIDYNGNTYQVKDRLCDYVTVNDINYDITYSDTNYSAATTIIDNSEISLVISGNTANTKKIKYIIDDKGNVLKESGYTITQRNGVEINGQKYPILSSITESSIEESCQIEGVETYDLEIMGTYGLNAVMCTPVVIDSFSDDGISRIESINSEIADNFSSFRFYFKATAFGEDGIAPEKYAEYALTSDHPISTVELYGLNRGIRIYQITDYITLPLALGNKIDPLPLKENIIQNDFVNEKVNENINRIVDMEKDVYYPAYKQDDDNFIPIEEIEFNLHFRTRNLDSWKVNEDDTENLGSVSANSIVNFDGITSNINGNFTTPYYTTTNESNWFVTDYYPYKEYIGNSGTTDVALQIQRTSDLIKFLNFTEEDIKYRKKKIAKSFLRLSFYSTTNPNTQVLLATSTIFMDENALYQKYLNFKVNLDDSVKNSFNNEENTVLKIIRVFFKTEGGRFYLQSDSPVDTEIQYSIIEEKTTDIYNESSTRNEIYLTIKAGETESYYVEDRSDRDYVVSYDTTNGYWVTSLPFIKNSIKYIDGDAKTENDSKDNAENTAISSSTDTFLPTNDNSITSQMAVKDKYNSVNSSEGFYLYLFREYSTNLRENTVYLKIDFCHAGNGLTIPFTVPVSQTDYVGPLYLDNYSDIAELKKGVALTDLYDNMYIPIKVKYDINTRKYYYYLPDEYVENDRMDVDKRIMMFNLFELKIRNQSYEADY